MSYVSPDKKAKHLFEKLGKKGGYLLIKEVINSNPKNYMTELFGGYRFEVLAVPYWEAVKKELKKIK